MGMTPEKPSDQMDVRRSAALSLDRTHLLG